MQQLLLLLPCVCPAQLCTQLHTMWRGIQRRLWSEVLYRNYKSCNITSGWNGEFLYRDVKNSKMRTTERQAEDRPPAHYTEHLLCIKTVPKTKPKMFLNLHTSAKYVDLCPSGHENPWKDLNQHLLKLLDYSTFHQMQAKICGLFSVADQNKP